MWFFTLLFLIERMEWKWNGVGRVGGELYSVGPRWMMGVTGSEDVEKVRYLAY